MRAAEADAHARKALQAVLKLSKEKWDEAARHALSAVPPDWRRRVWWPQAGGVGLVFNCRLGAPQLHEPVALAQALPDGGVKVRDRGRERGREQGQNMEDPCRLHIADIHHQPPPPRPTATTTNHRHHHNTQSTTRK